MAALDSSTAFLKDGASCANATVAVDPIITEKMLLEERLLELKTVREEQQLRNKVQEQEKKREQEEKCFKRLHLVLSRSSIYAKFLADKLQKYEEIKRKNDEEQLKKSNVKSGSIPKQSTKRKAATSSSKKKAKTGNNVADFLQESTKRVEEANEDASKVSFLDRQPKLITGGIMRDYQIDGYEWLKTLFENGLNGILADEMGLGKTIQCIAFIAHLVEMGVSGPFFICGPLSTVPNWYAEFKRFAPDLPVILYHGDKAERVELRKKIVKKVRNNDILCFPVVITSYHIALNDASKLAPIEWKMLVIDEAHRIKNFQCKLIQSLKKYNAVHRLLLTGTPLQNDLTELWSLLNFILPEIFDDLQVFQSWFDVSRLAESRNITDEIIAQEQEKQIVSIIHQILTPFLLRRTKSDVELDLPPKKTVVVHAPLTQLQQKYYIGIVNCLLRRLKKEDEMDESVIISEGRSKRKSTKSIFYGCDDNDSDEFLETEAKENIPSQVSNGNNKIVEIKSSPLLSRIENVFEKTFNIEAEFSEINLKLTNVHMMLRKLCCHPYLISYPLDPYTHQYLVDENIVKTSGKMLVLDTLLPQLKERGHKVLLFSQFVSMLKILEDYCAFRKYKYTCLYGSMNLSEREEQLEEFKDDESTFIFLISTRAGGLGINLTSADTVIMYDTDWNPQSDLQAQDRCHRIGQTKPVVVYHLVSPNSYDEKVFNRATDKRKLEKVIIQKGRFCSKNGLMKQQCAITKEELLELLESSDTNSLVSAENFVLSPEKLKSILDRSDMIAKSNK